MTMQPEEAQVTTERAAEDEDEELGSTPSTPPIDEDVAGSVNAAVPDADD